MSKKVTDAELRTLLGQLSALVQKHGAMTPEVKAFVREHLDVEEFPDLAAVLILAKKAALRPASSAPASTPREKVGGLPPISQKR